jgi:hypothetical protein
VHGPLSSLLVSSTVEGTFGAYDWGGNMQVAVGKDLFSVCGKCGPTWHVVVSMEGPKVTKVQCKQCMGYHRYKAAPGEVDINKAVAKRTKVGAGRARSVNRRTATRKTNSPEIEPDLNRPVRGYAVRDTYEPGDRIEHPKFGQGVVESIPDPGKMVVFFEEGRRTLIQGRQPRVSP